MKKEKTALQEFADFLALDKGERNVRFEVVKSDTVFLIKRLTK